MMNLTSFLACLIVIVLIFAFPTVFFVIYQVISLIQTGNSLSADTLLNSGKKKRKAERKECGKLKFIMFVL